MYLANNFLLLSLTSINFNSLLSYKMNLKVFLLVYYVFFAHVIGCCEFASPWCAGVEYAGIPKKNSDGTAKLRRLYSHCLS